MSTSDGGAGGFAPDLIAALANDLFKGTPARDVSLTSAPALPSVSHLPSAGLPHMQGAPVMYGLPTPLGVPTPNNVPSYPGMPAVTGLPGAPAWPSVSHIPSAGLPEAQVGQAHVRHADARHAHVSQPQAAWLEASPRAPEYYFTSITPSVPHAADARSPLGVSPFSVDAVRRDFPILEERVNGKKLVWLDNAATTHKPQSVIDRIAYFYAHENSNVHRGAHTLAARSTDAYESARGKVQKFLNAPSPETIVFTRGTTESINLVAQSWGRRHLSAGDEIVITWLEHHSNIVPWQLLCAETGAKLRVAPVDDKGELLIHEYERLFNKNTKLVSITHVSNALGTVLPVQELTAIAHRYGAKVLVDGAQAVSHFPVDVQAIDSDFYVLSGHKLFAPTGIGVLYGKKDVLESMPPWQGGGNMIADVTFDKTVYNPAPSRFEAGTGNIADAVGLGAAIDYLDRIGLPNAARHEHQLLEYGTARLLEIPRLRLIGTAREKAGVMSFVIDDVPTEQVGQALAREGIAVRSGHHCAQPALRRYGLETTVRPSLAFYNTYDEIDALIDVLKQLQRGW